MMLRVMHEKTGLASQYVAVKNARSVWRHSAPAFSLAEAVRAPTMHITLNTQSPDSRPSVRCMHVCCVRAQRAYNDNVIVTGSRGAHASQTEMSSRARDDEGTLSRLAERR